MVTENKSVFLQDIVIRVFDESFDKRTFYSLMGESFALKSVRKEVPYLDNEPGRVWFIATLKNNPMEVVGFVSYQEMKSTIQLKNDFVYPRYRRNGIYNKLNLKRLEHAQKIGKAIEILAKKEFTSYYQRLGFKEAKSFVKYNRMRKEKEIERKNS